MLLIMEKVIRKFLDFKTRKAKIKQRLLILIKPKVAKFSFLSCHKLKTKLINRFLEARLRIYMRSESRKIKRDAALERSYGSKSMFMNKSAINQGIS